MALKSSVKRSLELWFDRFRKSCECGKAIVKIIWSVSENTNINIKHRRKFHSKLIDVTNKASHLRRSRMHGVSIYIFLFSILHSNCPMVQYYTAANRKIIPRTSFRYGNERVTQKTHWEWFCCDTQWSVYFNLKYKCYGFFVALKQRVLLWTTPYFGLFEI